MGRLEHPLILEGRVGIVNKAISRTTVAPIKTTKVNKRIDERIDDVSMVVEKVNKMSPLQGEETTDPGGKETNRRPAGTRIFDVI